MYSYLHQPSYSPPLLAHGYGTTHTAKGTVAVVVEIWERSESQRLRAPVRRTESDGLDLREWRIILHKVSRWIGPVRWIVDEPHRPMIEMYPVSCHYPSISFPHRPPVDFVNANMDRPSISVFNGDVHNHNGCKCSHPPGTRTYYFLAVL